MLPMHVYELLACLGNLFLLIPLILSSTIFHRLTGVCLTRIVKTASCGNFGIQNCTYMFCRDLSCDLECRMQVYERICDARSVYTEVDICLSFCSTGKETQLIIVLLRILLLILILEHPDS